MEKKCFHLSVLIYSNIYWGPHGNYSSLLIIGSFVCILCLYILSLITHTEWFCTLYFYKHMYSVFLKLDICVIFSTDRYRYIGTPKESSYLGVQIN